MTVDSLIHGSYVPSPDETHQSPLVGNTMSESAPTAMPAANFIEAEYEESEPDIVISHPANMPLLRVVANILVEAKEHSRRLEGIYDTLRTLQTVAPPRVAADLLDAYEQHHAATVEHLVEIKELTK
jgi:hypothetical protein